MYKYICIRNLIFSNGSCSFTKGKIYTSKEAHLTIDSILVDNDDDPHTLGRWVYDFKLKISIKRILSEL